MRSTLGLTLLLSAACSGWHAKPYMVGGDAGPPAVPYVPPEAKDGGEDAGEDAGTDANVPPGPRLGDVRAKSVACGMRNESCGGGEECCAAWDDTSSKCSTSCGPTEPKFGCDGPEDCDQGAVCCHHPKDGVLIGECIKPAAAPPKKSGGDKGTPTKDAPAKDPPAKDPPAVELCANVTAGDRLACHDDKDCPKQGDKPQVCRIAKEESSFFGYCRLADDVTTTPGHDDVGLVSCGSDEHATVCGYQGNPCCVGHGGMKHGACSTDGECGFSELEVVCDGPEDCKAGQSCFYVPDEPQPDGGVARAYVECRASDDKKLPVEAVERCHTEQDCTQQGQVCKQDTDTPWGSCVKP